MQRTYQWKDMMILIKIPLAYRIEILKWPQVRQGYATVYRNFYNILLKCESLTNHRNWNLFNSPYMLCTLISKLPMSVGDRWNRRVQFKRKSQLRDPDLEDFIKFLDEETELINDLLYFPLMENFIFCAVWLGTVQDISHQTCRWEKQVFINQ